MSEGRCKICEGLDICPVCNESTENFDHVGVRASGSTGSSVWHYAQPCGHRVRIDTATTGPGVTQVGKLAVYQGGPLWKDGYQWVNVFWGLYWTGQKWIDMIDGATRDIETNPSYSGGLKQYNVGIGSLHGHVVIPQDPPASVSNKEIGKQISVWVSGGTLPDLQGKGAYNIFLPPGVKATLSSEGSCAVFCDYHDSAGGDSGPFFTCEPYPCQTGCNQCDSVQFDTLTQGLSEEMVELKTDMNPGTGWVIGNEEICDYCDKNFVCNQISTGEYVNAWYSDSAGACWSAKS